jgi:hypothetical protein
VEQAASKAAHTMGPDMPKFKVMVKSSPGTSTNQKPLAREYAGFSTCGN